MKSRYIVVMLFLSLTYSLFSLESIDHKNTVTFVDETDIKSETCVLISYTVNKTLQILFSQLENYSVINSIEGSDIRIDTKVATMDNLFVAKLDCHIVHDESRSFTLSSKPFQVLDTYSTVDSLAISIINTLSGKNISISKVILNNGFIPDYYGIYLNGNKIDIDVLDHIVTGTYHLQVKDQSKPESNIILDINPLVVATSDNIYINFTCPTNPNDIMQASNANSYESNNEYLSCKSWNSSWKLFRKGKTVIRFHANATENINIAFAPFQNTQTIIYSIILGGWDNTKSAIYRNFKNNNYDAILTSAYSIKPNNDYWIIFDKDSNIFSIGEGKDISKQRIFSHKSSIDLSAIDYFSLSNKNNVVQYSNIKVSSE